MAAHDGGFIALERARGCFLPCSQRTLLGRRWLVIDAGPRQRWWVSRPHAAEPLPPPWPTRGMLLVESLPRVWPQPHSRERLCVARALPMHEAGKQGVGACRPVVRVPWSRSRRLPAAAEARTSDPSSDGVQTGVAQKLSIFE